ncbi:hypothetical protein [Streptomyces sp. S186]|uniref:hypothetical protein n=1 Tax=Streptomyces sp. S186 TaxID=3434395 RepID=UPI003F665C06
MEQMPYPYEGEPRRPTDEGRGPLRIAAPAISTAVVLIEVFVLGWLFIMTAALCGSACHYGRGAMRFSFILTVCGWGLVIPMALLLICWLLPWRRRYDQARKAAAILAPFSLGALYIFFNVLLALS